MAQAAQAPGCAIVDPIKEGAAEALRELRGIVRLLLSPNFAAAAMAFSSVSVIDNALRLRRFRL